MCSVDLGGVEEEEQAGVTEQDLKVLLAYIDEKDGGLPWQLFMDGATPTLSFRAWRRDPKVRNYSCIYAVVEQIYENLLKHISIIYGILLLNIMLFMTQIIVSKVFLKIYIITAFTQYVLIGMLSPKQVRPWFSTVSAKSL